MTCKKRIADIVGVSGGRGNNGPLTEQHVHKQT